MSSCNDPDPEHQALHLMHAVYLDHLKRRMKMLSLASTLRGLLYLPGGLCVAATAINAPLTSPLPYIVVLVCAVCAVVAIRDMRRSKRKWADNQRRMSEMSDDDAMDLMRTTLRQRSSQRLFNPADLRSVSWWAERATEALSTVCLGYIVALVAGSRDAGIVAAVAYVAVTITAAVLHVWANARLARDTLFADPGEERNTPEI